MARWGYRAMESDTGLDILQYIGGNCMKEGKELSLRDTLKALQDAGMLDSSDCKNTEPFDEACVALTELCVHWAETAELCSYHNSRYALTELAGLKRFHMEDDALGFLRRRMEEIQDDIDCCEREYAAFWFEAADYYDWTCYIDRITSKLAALPEA